MVTTEIPQTRLSSGEQKRPDPEVVERPRRRTFTAEYRMAILREADACSQAGQVGALLRREGLYSSHLTEWRHRRDEAARAGLGQRRGRRPAHPADVENARLQRENARLAKDLAAAQMVIDVQKKSRRSWVSLSRAQSRGRRRDG
jgi:transposase